MKNIIQKHFKLLNKLFGNYRWFQVIFLKAIEVNKTNNIYWKHHKTYQAADGLYVDIIEFIYKHTHKGLRIDSRMWRYEKNKIVNWIKKNWDTIPSMGGDDINVLIKL